MMHRVYIAVGSNQDAAAQLPRAADVLRAHPDITLVRWSPVYETAAVGDERAYAYLNAAGLIETALSPEALKEALRAIETQLGRDRSQRASVAIDLDIVLFNDDPITIDGKPVPDPGIVQHAFVAVPLADIAPDVVHPVTRQTMASIAATFTDTDDITRRDDVDLTPFQAS